jgi:hippurate hydrolase
MPVIENIANRHSEMTAWRQDFHAHPEIGFEETRTSGLIADRLAAFGIEVHRGIGKTGVVGTLRCGGSNRSIGLRVDMDALPIKEANRFEHRSRYPGRMHACGHDGHATMLLGAARYLAETRRFDGVVHFIFQPAEEGIGGSLAMLADGLFERFPCDAVFSMHNRPSIPVGQFAVRSGPMMAGGAFFDIHVTGKGAHGARPESGVDPVLVAAHIAVALQSIVSRQTPPAEPAVISVTKIQGGDAYNVIPHTAHLAGTARAFSREVTGLIELSMRRIASGVAQAFGAAAEIDFRLQFAPTVNDARQAEFAAKICAELVGEENVHRNPPLTMASDDFSFMLEKVPGCHINIGIGSGERACEVHNPSYDFNDAALPLGASFFAHAVEARLRASS